MTCGYNDLPKYSYSTYKNLGPSTAQNPSTGPHREQVQSRSVPSCISLRIVEFLDLLDGHSVSETGSISLRSGAGRHLFGWVLQRRQFLPLDRNYVSLRSQLSRCFPTWRQKQIDLPKCCAFLRSIRGDELGPESQ
jgi:hypothetical protein